MGKKNIVYIIIFFLVVMFLYFKYQKEKKMDKIKIESEVSETITYSSNIINDVYYLSKDKKGNQYIISASEGKIDFNQSNIVFLENVKALIKLNNSKDIEINSSYGKYDTVSYDTIFSKNVVINYEDNKIKGEYLDLSMQRNSIIISRNVVYTNLTNILKADVIEINIGTKDAKIFMHKNDEQVNIKNKNVK
jgi:hypothetical protein